MYNRKRDATVANFRNLPNSFIDLLICQIIPGQSKYQSRVNETLCPEEVILEYGILWFGIYIFLEGII